VYEEESGAEVNGTFHRELMSAYNNLLTLSLEKSTAADCADTLYRKSNMLVAQFLMF